jgi:hypothetical protein
MLVRRLNRSEASCLQVSIANTLYGTDTTGHHFARIPFSSCTTMEG